VSISLRPYQLSAVTAIREAFRAGKRAPLYVAPTGSGKTVTFSYMAQGAQAKGNQVVIMVHRQELIRQISNALTSFDVPHGIIFSGHRPSPHLHTHVASVQSLTRRLGAIQPPDFLIVDEGHHSTSESYRRIFDAWPAVPRLGVTATPSRLDGRGLGDVFDSLILGPTVQSLIDQWFLARPVYYAPSAGPSKLHIVAGDYNRKESEFAMDVPKITGDAIEHYGRLCEGQPALVFCVSLKHAHAVTDEFRLHGYRAEMIDGTMDDEERRRLTDGFREGCIQILVSVDLLGEGYDAPGASVGIMLRPTASLALWRQHVGRILRPAPGKTQATILDHAGNTMRHGFAEEPIEWTLDQSKPRRQTEKVFPNRQCPACYRVHRFALACPQCGHVYPIESRDIRQTDGTLEQITAAEVARVRARQEVGRAETLEALIAIGKQRGYKPTWAYIQWKHRRWRKTPKVQAPEQQEIEV
jgi:superfamily II DNA or RNA helicase